MAQCVGGGWGWVMAAGWRAAGPICSQEAGRRSGCFRHVSFGPWPMGLWGLHSGWAFLPQSFLSGNALTDTLRGVFPW